MQVFRVKTQATPILAALAAAVLLGAVGCASGGGSSQPPQPAPPPPPVEMVDVPVHLYHLTTPGVGVPDVIGRCSPDYAFNTDPNGDWQFRAPAGVEMSCTFEREGYAAQGASFVPGLDENGNPRVLSTWMQRVTPNTPEVPAPTPGTPVVSRNARQGRLRLADGCYRDDTGCVLPLYAHAGNGVAIFVRNQDRMLAEFDKVARAGYHGLRLWGTLGCGPQSTAEGCTSFWRGHEVGPHATVDYWGWVRRVAQALNQRGLRAVWSQGDIGQIRDRRDYMQRLAEIDREVPFIDFIDGGNEAWQTGEGDEHKLAAFVGYFQAAGGPAIRSLTSPPGEGKDELDRYSIDPAQIFDVHSFRDNHLWDKIRHIFSIPLEGRPRRAFGIGSEPPGNGALVSVTANKHELDNEGVPLLAVQSMIARQAFVWFSGEGVKIERGLDTEAGFWSTPATVDLLPKDLMQFGTLHHGGASQGAVRVVGAQDEGRVDCRTSADGRFACTLYGPPRSYNFPVLQSFAGKLCDPDDACQDVRLARGQTVDVSFTRGRVLVGRVQ